MPPNHRVVSDRYAAVHAGDRPPLRGRRPIVPAEPDPDSPRKQRGLSNRIETNAPEGAWLIRDISGEKMIPVYGTLVTILICTFIPPVIDYFQKRDEHWRWSKAVMGYGVMTIMILVLPMLIGVSRYIDLLFIIAAVAFAVLIVQITYTSTLFVIFMSSVILTIAILWDVARYNVGTEPLRFVLRLIEWHVFVLPLIAGLITLFAVRHLTARLKKSRTNLPVHSDAPKGGA